MSKVTKGAVAVAALTAAQKVARKVLTSDDGGGRSAGADRWHVVTVNLPPERVSPDGLAPVPLRDLPDVEVRMQKAPADKGTEIAVKGAKGADVGTLRRALREAKSLLETGEVLLPSGPPTSQPTPLTAPLRAVTAHGREEGRL